MCIGTVNPRAAAHDSEFDEVGFVVTAAVGTLLSMVATGFVVGVRNDLFYLPILDALYSRPQFADDPFIQSLRYFSAGPWILLSGVGKYGGTYLLLLSLQLLSRFISFAGFLACADLLGIRTRSERTILTALLCATPLLRGQSFAGDGGLFINYFTHSEIANGLSLLIIYFLIRGSLLVALVLNGLAFFVNAFIGVWNAAPIIAITLWVGLNGAVGWRKVVWEGLLGTFIAAAISAPVIWNILTNPDFGQPLGFDYVAFLEEFWPYHFLFWDTGTYARLDLLSLVTLGFAAFIALGAQARPFLVATAAYAVIYAMGIIAPYMTHSPLILNLHLLRVSAFFHLLTTLGALVLATRWWSSKEPARARLFAPILIILLCMPIKMDSIQPAINLTLACAIIVASHSRSLISAIPVGILTRRLQLKYLALGCVAVSFSIVVTRNAVANANAGSWLREWTAVANWARASTAQDARFLLPTWSFIGSQARITPGSMQEEAVLNSGIFETVAQRSVWIDFRRGAAVMWSPSYYEEWHRRVVEVNSLTSYEAAVAYAKRSGIEYLVEVCKADANRTPAFSTARLCVYSVTAGR